MFDDLTPTRLLAAAAAAPPGLDVIEALIAVDTQVLTDRARVNYLVAWEKQAAWVAAWAAEAVDGVAEGVRALERTSPSGDGEMGERAVRCEIAAATRVSDAVADSRVMVAGALTGPLSVVADALRAGAISYAHASAIVELTAGLTDAQADWVARRVLDRARTQTVAQLRASLRRAAIRADPDLARRNAKDARNDRDVEWWPLPDGQAELRLRADAADVLAVAEAVRAAAAQLGLADKEAGVERTAGQRRAAALVALVTGVADGTPKQVTVHVTVGLPTLLNLQDHPGELVGYGPLPAPIVRELAADGVWRRLVHEPIQGHLLDLGRVRYRPSPALAEHVRTRAMTCVFPSCNRRAAACDLDHTVPHKPDGSGGATDPANLYPLCPQHHRVKHETGWILRSRGDDPPVWISPMGHEYPVEHHDHSAGPEPDTADAFEDLTELRAHVEGPYAEAVEPQPPPACPF